MELNETFFDKSFETIVKVLPLPDMAEDALVALKDFLTEDIVKEKIKGFIDNILNKDGKIVSNISEVKKRIKEEGLINGISMAIDVAVDNAKKSKMIDKNTKNLLNDTKNLIVNKIDDKFSKNNIYNGQDEILKNIDEKYNLWEESLNKLDTKQMLKLQNEITKEYLKLNPSLELLNKINEMNNLYQLAKNKISNGEKTITDLEKEICRKAG